MLLAIVIINYKTPDLTVNCLKSLEGEVEAKDIKVVVVDNYSNDDSVQIINNAIEQSGWLKWCNLIVSDRNGGFSAGNNIGIKSLEAENYLLLNSDTVVLKSSIEKMLLELDKDPTVGIVGPRLEWPDGTKQISTFRFHGILSELIRGASTSTITKLFKNFDVPLETLDVKNFPEWISFACVLIRKAVIEQIGLMDEKFFLYFEDVEYCLRAKKAGWKIQYAETARVIHYRGGSAELKSSQKLKKRLPAYYYQSRAYYFRKKSGAMGLFLANLAWSTGFMFAKLREIFGNKIPHTCEKEFLDTWNIWR